MIKKLQDRIGSDRADSLVSAVFILPMLFFMLVTTIDFGIYMSNRGQIQAVARDGARTVAIMGGDGTSTRSTNLEFAYGQSKEEACSGINTEFYKGNISSLSTTECNVVSALTSQSGLVNVTIANVNCGPSVAGSIGERTYCEVNWDNGGIPGSAMSFAKGSGDGKGLGGQHTTTGSAESEVQLTNSDTTNRR